MYIMKLAIRMRELDSSHLFLSRTVTRVRCSNSRWRLASMNSNRALNGRPEAMTDRTDGCLNKTTTTTKAGLQAYNVRDSSISPETYPSTVNGFYPIVKKTKLGTATRWNHLVKVLFHNSDVSGLTKVAAWTGPEAFFFLISLTGHLWAPWMGR